MPDKIVIEYEKPSVLGGGAYVPARQEWVKSSLFCLACGTQELWQLLDSAHDCEGDSGDLHICLACKASFYTQGPSSLNPDDPELQRLTEALRNA